MQAESRQRNKDMARELDFEGVCALWEKVQHGKDITGWLPGKAFEYLVLRGFELEGAEVVWPFEVKLDGVGVAEEIDGVIYLPNGTAVLVESKDHKDNLSFGAIAKMRSQLLRRPAATLGVIFSRSGFTLPAKTLAQHLGTQTILLWEGPEFEHALHRQGLLEGLTSKYRYSVEYGLSDFNLLTEN